jgi:superfamily II DNA or RNA helicase
MPIPFSIDDLGRSFDARAITRGRSMILLGQVEVELERDTIVGTVDHLGMHQAVRLTAVMEGGEVGFTGQCTCRQPGCAHRAAIAIKALERFPGLRKAAPAKAPDVLAAKPAAERRRLVLELAPAKAPHSCVVTTKLVHERTRQTRPATPAEVLADPTILEASHALARLLGGGTSPDTFISQANAPAVLEALARSGQARWQLTGKRLVHGVERLREPDRPFNLPPKSAIINTAEGEFYVDGETGKLGRLTLRKPAPPPQQRTRTGGGRGGGRRNVPTLTELAPTTPERLFTPTLHLHRLHVPDDFGRLQLLDVGNVAFDYDGIVLALDDERQIVRAADATSPGFLRDQTAEAEALDALREDGFVQMRVPHPDTPRGRRVLTFLGRDAPELWQGFVARRLPALLELGWRVDIATEFGPQIAEDIGTFDMRVEDAEGGQFTLDFGIEIDGFRRPLLPILTRLLERGGMETAQVIDDFIITSLDDGRVIRLPVARIAPLLSVMADLVEAASTTEEDTLLLPAAEASQVVDLEELLTARWQNAAAIENYCARFREEPVLEHAPVPAGFTISLRPYQQHGVDWLQHLRANGMAGFLADDMGLGKTAQTIAHIAIEHEAGRLDRPALIVVPTSLVTNWTNELAKFAPFLKVTVLHGIDRHERRSQLDGYHVVITTYTVLARDIEEMSELPWHMVVLDEAQAIKSPDAKATKAVCQLNTRHRLCLSGTPIENNLEELWSQFAFLMPGLLGDRRSFAKRFRTPIEKREDNTRRLQLVRRIKPFILRRTKSEVATELPPKHTILRRITLAPAQRELYETIRATLYDRVREQIAQHSLAKSRIVVLDALLKLRQVCCDPRLVKLQAAREVLASAKLDDLMEMLGEMLPEGRRVLLFSQFTSMLDLIKPRLAEAGIPFVELRGDTRDRAAPVRRFEAGEVPLFLISLKAGGRGLNLTSADTVIHYDPWWNPAVEDQASDRAHRIGQTKSVFVYKMVAADTVEERIIDMQERKAALAKLAFEEGEDLPQLEFDEIEYLFGTKPEKMAA